jgi:hypothetical protein
MRSIRLAISGCRSTTDAIVVAGPAATSVSGSFSSASSSSSVASVGAARSSGLDAPRHGRSNPVSRRSSSSLAAGKLRTSGALPKVTDAPRT